MILLNHSNHISVLKIFKDLHYDGDYDICQKTIYSSLEKSDTETNMTKALYQMCSWNLKHAVQSS